MVRPLSPISSSDMHVLTLTPFFPSRENKVSGCFIAEPIERLAEFGIHSSVIAVSPIHHSRRQLIASAAADWIRYPQIPGTLGLSSAGRLLYARLLGRVRRLHKVKRIDVIHAHAALPCGQAAMLLSGRLNIPFVVTVHGLDVFNACAQGGAPAAARRKISMDIYSAARNVICVSRKAEEILRRGMQSEPQSTVVYNGVNPDCFSPNSAGVGQSDLEILVVGTLLPSKGHELVLRAVGKLSAAFPKLGCHIIGEGPARTRFEALARDLGIGDQVCFLGRRSRLEVAEAMRRCTVFALPSWNEALGCVYLEGMACGKVVIGCRGQGIDEVIEHERNGWLVPADGLDELVQGLSALLASPELRSKIGIAARQTILSELTLAHQAKRLASIYRQAAA
jgi:teichuronic acid biosynthesis glycosyltransferase TuaC